MPRPTRPGTGCGAGGPGVEDTMTTSTKSNKKSSKKSTTRSAGAITTCGRAIHLVDIENLGVDVSGATLAAGIGAYYRRWVQPGAFDQFVVGCDRSRLLDASVEFPGAQMAAGFGQHGGELAVIGSVDVADLARRFATLVIASGDGYFAGVAEQAAALGMRVVVVSRAGRLSGALRHAAHGVLTLPELTAAAAGGFVTAA
jgi:hypothetical protein